MREEKMRETEKVEKMRKRERGKDKLDREKD